MTEPIRIFGHRNPDADAICSALAYADLKSRTVPGAYQAARCGISNARIDAILDRFQVPLPPFVGDVTPRIREVMARDLVTISSDTTCAEALELLEEHDIQVLPVLREGGRLDGTVSIFQLGKHFLPRTGLEREMRRVRASISGIGSALTGTAHHMETPDEVEELFVWVAAMNRKSFERMAESEFVNPAQTVLVVGDRAVIQRRAVEMGIRLLVVTGGLEVDAEVAELARERGVSLVVSPWDSATSAWIIRTATRVDELVDREYVGFDPDLTVEEARRRTAELGPAVFMVTTEGDRLHGLFTRRDILRPSRTQIILVDHNELTQAVPGAEQVQIVEVVDHHRLGDLRTRDPILFINRPVGSTCTIVADLYRQAGLTPEASMAGVLMGGLVSDTLNLRSPTATHMDTDILEWLEGLAGTTGSELAEIIFSSGSVVASGKPEEVVKLDRKLYEEGGVRFSISQVEELGFGAFRDAEPVLRDALEAERRAEGLHFACLLVTDIKEENSLLLVTGDPALIESIPYPEVEAGEVFRLDGVLSRKKQLLPLLSGIMRKRGAA